MDSHRELGVWGLAGRDSRSCKPRSNIDDKSWQAAGLLSHVALSKSSGFAQLAERRCTKAHGFQIRFFFHDLQQDKLFLHHQAMCFDCFLHVNMERGKIKQKQQISCKKKLNRFFAFFLKNITVMRCT